MANPDFTTLLETQKPDPVSLAIMEEIDIDRCEAFFWDYVNHSFDQKVFTAQASYRRGFQDSVLLLQAHQRSYEKQ